MPHRTRIKSIAVSAMCALALAACATPRSGPPAADLVPTLDALDGRLARLHAASGVPALAVAVLAGPPGEARVVWARAYGVLDVRTRSPASVESPFMLASASKLATGLVVMQAVDAGRVSLDAPITPPFAWGCRQAVTLRGLATHTSGVIDTDAVDEAYAPGDPGQPRDAFLASQLGPGGGACMGQVGSFAYSNTGIALAASVVEAASGVPFERLSRERLFAPLGMRHTGWFLRDFPDVATIATPHDAGGHPMPHYGYPTWPDGQLRASVLDAARILALLMNEGRVGTQQVVSAQAVSDMLRPQVPSSPDGQGLFVQWKRGLAGHMGGDDGVRTFVLFDPATRIGAVVLANQDGPQATAATVEVVRQTLRNPVLAATLAATPPTEAETQVPRR